jgi:hypothetical protein
MSPRWASASARASQARLFSSYVTAHIVVADYLGKHPENSDLPSGQAMGPSQLHGILTPAILGGRQSAAWARLPGRQNFRLSSPVGPPPNDEILCVVNVAFIGLMNCDIGGTHIDTSGSVEWARCCTRTLLLHAHIIGARNPQLTVAAAQCLLCFCCFFVTAINETQGFLRRSRVVR